MLCTRSVLLAALLASSSPTQQAEPASSAPGTKCRALLVGVTEYPELKKSFEARGQLAEYESRVRLKGPGNDVLRMQQTLVSVLNVAPHDIAMLSASAGPDRTPTRANIVAGLQQLAREATANELVIVFLAGHGSQIPDQNGDEVDGLDEVFLPADTSVWDERTKTVTGAIVDDEFAPLLAAIRAKGARVWLIVDSCHAGTMMRGGDDTDVERALDGKDLGLPAVGAGVVAPRDERAASLDQLASGITALYAVHPTQRAVETTLPVGSDGRHGVFTWFLTEQLARSGPGVTFEELHQKVVNSLWNSGRGHLTPVLEGEGSVTVLAGAAGGMRLQLRKEGGRLLVDGGSLHGLEVGDVLDVFAAGKRGDQTALLGRVEVVSAASNSTEVTATKTSGVPKDKLPTGDTMLPVELSLATLQLRKVKLHLVDAAGASLPSAQLPTQPCQDEAVLQRAEWVDDRAGADYLVARTGTGWTFTPTRDTTEWRQNATDDRFAALVHRMFRARGLRTIASSSLGALPAGVKLVVELLDADGKLVGPMLSGQAITPGSRVRFQVTNQSSGGIDVRFYCLDSALGLGDMRPGKSAELPAGRDLSVTVTFNDTTVGPEQLVVIVSPPGTAHLDALTQELSTVRSASRGDGPRGLLAGLLGEGGATRGGEGAQEDCAGIFTIPYRIEWGTSSPVARADMVQASWAATVRDRLQRRARSGWQPAPSVDKDRSLSDLYQRVAPAVVAIHSGDGHGTGFLIDAERGLVLTNHHVVADAKRFSSRGRWLHQVIFGDLDAQGFMRIARSDVLAEVIHEDEHRDLAVLQIQGDRSWLKGRPTIQVGPNPAKPASACVIVGHPSSGMLWSIRSGLVSALGSWPQDQIDNIVRLAGLSGDERTAAVAELSHEKPRQVLLSTCGANPGDSGSPLVDEAGRLIAVTFAVPSDRMDKEFTYHVALDEVLAFLAAIPSEDTRLAPQPPSVWFRPNGLNWAPPKAKTGHGMLQIVLGRPSQEGNGGERDIDLIRRTTFFDLDGDSTLGEVPAMELVRAMEAGATSLDFELAVAELPGLTLCAYDRDGDGKFDLVLMDTDEDRRANFEFRLDATATEPFAVDSGTPLLQLLHLGDAYADSRSAAYKRAARLLNGLLK
ncbi:MAG: caspase family protein [Planctomycetota bacterium]